MSRSSDPREPYESLLAAACLLHLADSALPIGSLAHSLGLESLTDSGRLTVAGLSAFLHAYLEESGFLEAVFCRAGFSLAGEAEAFCAAQWLEWNDRLSALKPAREARLGSAVLGRNFLNLVAAVEELSVVREALAASSPSGVGDGKPAMIHHSLAFGLVGGALGVGADRVVLAYLHQSVASLVSACQRLLPLGQTRAARILWSLKPTMIKTAARSTNCATENACCFTPLLDWGAMEHPALTTRLFIS
jgi:urease accessory protein